MSRLVNPKSIHSIDISILKCVDCFSTELSYYNGAIRCMSCQREYNIIDDSIISMLPSRISSVKQNEMRARDNDSLNYDRRRSEDYTSLLDYFCIEKHSGFLSQDTVVLDLGAGTGRSTVKLTKACKIVFAVDFSLESLRILRRKLINAGISNVVLMQADISRLPFYKPDCFDFINCEDFIQHIPSFGERERILSELYCFLKKNGRLAITAYHYSRSKQSVDFIQPDKVGESGKQGFHLNDIYYYNFSLPELYVLLYQQSFRILEYGLFFFELPVWARILRRATRCDRIKLEKSLYRFLKSSANRVYFCASK
ncbi:MAG: methyltransferase domain-containing protein [candidate division Zixibacteria bacterium]|nr:methyltransferase domain-containing protein [candidate division Zixibacteria bacterium]